MTRVRPLDIMFRDTLIQDCVRLGINKVDVFHVVGTNHVGRMNTVALVKKWVRHINKMYPGSMSVSMNHLTIDPDYLSFMSGHNDMGTSEKDRRLAWASIRSIIDDDG